MMRPGAGLAANVGDVDPGIRLVDGRERKVLEIPLVRDVTRG